MLEAGNPISLSFGKAKDPAAAGIGAETGKHPIKATKK